MTVNQKKINKIENRLFVVFLTVIKNHLHIETFICRSFLPINIGKRWHVNHCRHFLLGHQN